MRFSSLILLFTIGLSPIPGNAGTLVGDWYQGDRIMEDTQPYPAMEMAKRYIKNRGIGTAL